jgi:hypothetical protein
MSTTPRQRSLGRIVPLAAVAVGLAAGSYGIASAASGSGSGSSSSSGSNGTSTQSAPSAARPWGRQRTDETLLTGTTAEQVKAAALAEVDGATVVRVETDADGHAKYEAHIVKADGTPATVYVDENFDVVGVETR